MENRIENDNGISLGDIFRTIFSQKWVALIIAVVITLAGTLGLYFLGRNDLTYEVSFVSKIPGSENSPLEFVFPDGKEFRYETMVSRENLEKAKASNSSFKDIKVSKMYETGDISIKRVLTETVVGSQQYEATYVISAKAEYFKTGVIARDFLKELTQFPNQYLADMHINYDRSLEASRTAIQYDKQLDYLSEQVNFLNTEYGKFITDYTGNFVVKDGKTLNFYQAQLQTFLDRGDIASLKNEAIKEHYVKSDESGKPLEAAIDKYNSEIFEKGRERDRIDKALQEALDRVKASLSEQSGSINLDADSIIKYTEQLVRLDQEIEDIKSYIESGQTNSNFDKEVDAVEAQVDVFTNDFAEIASTIYKTKTTVSFNDTSIITVSGGRGIVSSLLISLVIGIVLACIVAYVVGWCKTNKRSNKKATVPVYSEVQLQAAATADDTDNTEDTKNDK